MKITLETQCFDHIIKIDGNNFDNCTEKTLCNIISKALKKLDKKDLKFMLEDIMLHKGEIVKTEQCNNCGDFNYTYAFSL